MWTLHGLGMLRLDLGDGYRLNVWNSEYKTPNVSEIHTHPWNLTSTIIVGVMRNHRYYASPSKDPIYNQQVVGCGCEVSELKGTPVQIRLFNTSLSVPTYEAGETYDLTVTQIHRADADDGTVTLMRKTGEPVDAKVFWSKETKWGDAKPCIATPAQVKYITQHSLDTWFND